MHRAEQVVEGYLDHPEESDEPTCGPGPFSMADADTVSEQLTIAGFEEISLRRCDLPIKIGDDLEHAVEFNMALGPAGEVLRLWEDRIDEIRPKIAARSARGAGRVRGARRRDRARVDLDHRRAGAQPNNLPVWPRPPQPNRCRRGSPRSASS